MDYLITKTKRNNLIISSSFLILNYIFLGLPFLFERTRGLDVVENGILSILFIIAYAYLLIVLIDFFKKNNLKKLEIVTTITLIAEIGNQILSLINSFMPAIPQFISSFFSIIAVISMIIWIILLLRLKSADYSALNSLRKYAFGLIAAFILGITISLITTLGGYYDYYDLMFLPIAIPYIFMINFALELKLEDE